MPSFAERLVSLRKQRSLSQSELGAAVGLEQSEISRMERSKRPPSLEVMQRVADFFGVSLDYMAGREYQGPVPDPPSRQEPYPPGPMVLLPVYEEAAAGAPCLADERPVWYAPVSTERVQHDLANYYLIRVAGDSMIHKGIMPGGLVMVHRQNTVDDGQTALLQTQESGVTIRRVRFLDDERVMLLPDNPRLDEEIVRADEITIYGRVVQAITDID